MTGEELVEVLRRTRGSKSDESPDEILIEHGARGAVRPGLLNEVPDAFRHGRR
jgi:hypothetical protein